MRRIFAGILFSFSLGFIVSIGATEISAPFFKNAMILLGLTTLAIGGILLSIQIAQGANHKRGGSYGREMQKLSRREELDLRAVRRFRY